MFFLRNFVYSFPNSLQIYSITLTRKIICLNMLIMKKKEKYFFKLLQKVNNEYNSMEIFYISKKCLAFKLPTCNISVDTDDNRFQQNLK